MEWPTLSKLRVKVGKIGYKAINSDHFMKKLLKTNNFLTQFDNEIRMYNELIHENKDAPVPYA